MIHKEEISVKVIGKTVEDGYFLGFKTGKKYIMAFEVIDENINGNPTMQKNIPFKQYCSFDVGEIINIIMYTKNHKTFYFTKEEAA